MIIVKVLNFCLSCRSYPGCIGLFRKNLACFLAVNILTTIFKRIWFLADLIQYALLLLHWKIFDYRFLFFSILPSFKLLIFELFRKLYFKLNDFYSCCLFEVLNIDFRSEHVVFFLVKCYLFNKLLIFTRIH